MEEESIKKTQTEGNLKMKKKMGTQTETSETGLTNRMYEMEKKIARIEDTIKEMNTLVKENVRSKNILA